MTRLRIIRLTERQTEISYDQTIKKVDTYVDRHKENFLRPDH